MKGVFTVRNVHILSLLFALGVMVVAAFGYVENNKAYINLFNVTQIEIGKCVIKENTGIVCPSCGLTRGFISIENADFQRAFHFNRMSIPAYGLLIGLIIFNILGIKGSPHAKRYGTLLGYIGFILCILLVVNYILRAFGI